MKIIQAMKLIKSNKEKIEDLKARIKSSCANLSHETPLYGPTTATKIEGWLQSIRDLLHDNMEMSLKIQKTNLATPVTITIGDKNITKSIAEWVLRRRLFAAVEHSSWAMLTDRGLKEGVMKTSVGDLQVTIQRHYNPDLRDKMLDMLRSEPHLIDSTLETVNAVTDLVD